MPLQHASANVLKRMKRGASGDIFLKLIERIRRTIPGVAIRTSFIVGFPGETAEDFDELCQFVEAARFDNLGVFTYSDEDTSASYALDGKVDGRTIQNRKRRLMAIQRKISRARNRALVGQEVDILVGGLSRETDLLWEGRMSTQAPEIDGVTLINDFEGSEPRPRRDPPPAHYRSARLRCGGHAARAHRSRAAAAACLRLHQHFPTRRRMNLSRSARNRSPWATPISRSAASAAAISTWATGPPANT